MNSLVNAELDVLTGLVPVDGKAIIELGCGAAKLARAAGSVSAQPSHRAGGRCASACQEPGIASGRAALRPGRRTGHRLPGCEFRRGADAQVASSRSLAVDGAGSRRYRPRAVPPRSSVRVRAGLWWTPERGDPTLQRRRGGARSGAGRPGCSHPSGAWEPVAERFLEMPVTFRDFADFE